MAIPSPPEPLLKNVNFYSIPKQGSHDLTELFKVISKRYCEQVKSGNTELPAIPAAGVFKHTENNELRLVSLFIEARAKYEHIAEIFYRCSEYRIPETDSSLNLIQYLFNLYINENDREITWMWSNILLLIFTKLYNNIYH